MQTTKHRNYQQLGGSEALLPKFPFPKFASALYVKRVRHISGRLTWRWPKRVVSVLPRVIDEQTVQPFKFWFNDSLQVGIHYHNELYYCLRETETGDRSKLYQLACRLSRHRADVLVTLTPKRCRLWANLRNQKVAAWAVSERLALPSADSLLRESAVPLPSGDSWFV